MNSNLKPFLISDIDINNIVYSDLKEGKNKNILYLKYKDNSRDTRLIFQTPSLLNCNHALNKDSYYELDVPLVGKNNNKTLELITFLKNMDKKFINDAKNYGSKWFNGKKNITYKSLIRSSTTQNKNGILRIKILNTNNFKTTILKENKYPIKATDIKENNYIKMILECYALWITKEGFGLYLKPVLLSVRPMKLNYNYSLIEDSESSENCDDDIIEDHVKTILSNESTISIKNNLSENNKVENEINMVENENNKVKNEINMVENDIEKNSTSENSIINANCILPTDNDTSEYQNTGTNIDTYKNYTTENIDKINLIDSRTSDSEIEPLNLKFLTLNSKNA